MTGPSISDPQKAAAESQHPVFEKRHGESGSPEIFWISSFSKTLMTQKPKLEKNKWFVFGINFE